MEIIENKTFDAERALYGSRSLEVKGCRFDGPADGESALKESSDIIADSCFLKIKNSEMTSDCRAALWYSDDIEITNTKMHGIKALRECERVTVKNCDIVSPEFGWSVRNIKMENTSAESEYFMLRSEELEFSGVSFKGKYSFQYIKNAVFDNCVFDTKDAFWHAENVTVRNSVVNGEYLGWYSDGVTFENCKITGTQPLCYCKNLRLVNCEMYNADLCFEKSEVDATVTTPVISVKNPLSGEIRLPSVGEIIRDGGEYKGNIIICGDSSKESA